METFFDNYLATVIVALGVLTFLSKLGSGVRGWMRSRSARHKLVADRERHERRLREIEKLDDVLAMWVADEAMADTLSDRIEAARVKVRVETRQDGESPPRPRERRIRAKLPFVRSAGK